MDTERSHQVRVLEKHLVVCQVPLLVKNIIIYRLLQQKSVVSQGKNYIRVHVHVCIFQQRTVVSQGKNIAVFANIRHKNKY